MPLFELEAGGKVYEIEAPDQGTALSAFQKMSGGAPAPEAPSVLDKLSKAWENPPPGLSLIGMAKGAYEGLKAPGEALQSENPISTEEMLKPSRDLAGTVMFGGTLGGMPAGAVASGLARRAPTPTPPVVAKSNPMLEAAERQAVPIPHFLGTDNMMTQRLAAGLKNVPGAGNTIVKATKETVDSLGNATKRVEEGFGTGSPEIAGGSAKDGILSWMGEGSKAISSRVYQEVDGLVKPDVARPLTATSAAVSEIMAKRANAKIPGTSPAVKLVVDAINDPAGMNYSGVKDLRSFIGDMTPEELVAKGVSKGEADKIYAALSQDLRATVQVAGGPAALKAFEKANTVHAQIMDRKKALAKVVGAKGDASPEAVFARLTAMAGSKSSADMSKLMQARKAMGSEAWDEVASGVVSKLGRDPQGNFSPDRFFTAYGNLSEGGRNLLFKTSGKDDLASALNDINLIVNAHKDKIGQFSNPSGTAQNLIGAGMVAQIFTDPTFIPKTLAGIGGGNLMARALSKPESAKAVREVLKATARVKKDRSPAALMALQVAERNLLAAIGQGALAQTE
jgi:hypothetical protein